MIAKAIHLFLCALCNCIAINFKSVTTNVNEDSVGNGLRIIDNVLVTHHIMISIIMHVVPMFSQEASHFGGMSLSECVATCRCEFVCSWVGISPTVLHTLY